MYNRSTAISIEEISKHHTLYQKNMSHKSNTPHPSSPALQFLAHTNVIPQRPTRYDTILQDEKRTNKWKETLKSSAPHKNDEQHEISNPYPKILAHSKYTSLPSDP